MKTYDVTITVTFKKPIKINGCCGEDAIEKAKDILLNTDLVEFTENDIDTIVCEAERSSEKSCADCDEDCDDNYCSEEREYLYDELY